MVPSKPVYSYTRQCAQDSLSWYGKVLQDRGSRALPNLSLCSLGNFLFHDRFYYPCYDFVEVLIISFFREIKFLSQTIKQSKCHLAKKI